MSFKEDANLDINELDKACLEQPSMYADWGELWAQAVRNLDRLKEQITAKKAEIDEQIRKDPSEFGWTMEKNPTETWISNQVILHSEVRELTDQSTEAQYLVNRMITAKQTMDHRLKSLGILAELYKGTYFAGSSKGATFVQDAVAKSQQKQRDMMENNPRMKKRLVKND